MSLSDQIWKATIQVASFAHQQYLGIRNPLLLGVKKLGELFVIWKKLAQAAFASEPSIHSWPSSSSGSQPIRAEHFKLRLGPSYSPSSPLYSPTPSANYPSNIQKYDLN